MKRIIKKIYIIIICFLLIPIQINAASISLNKSQVLLDVGYSETLKYTIASGLNESTIVWHSSNPNVATVQNGKITAKTRGTAIITATINGESSTCRVVVSNDYIPVKGVNLNKTTLSILIGNKDKLVATINPSDATNKNVIWKSSDTSIATVDSNGNVTAKKAGSTIITANSGEYSSTCKVTVVNTIPLKSISLNKTSLTIKEKSTETLSVTYNPSNATNKKITWKSSNTNVATVDGNGKITAITPGTTTITAISNDGGYVGTSKVTIEAISKKVESITLDKQELNINPGEEVTLTYTINPTYAENKNVTWTSKDKKIATVEDGIVKALKPGTTEIKITTEDGNKEAVCKITVTSPPLKEIKFKEESKTIYLDEEITLNPTLTPETAVLENVTWSSSDETIVSISNGTIKGISIGEATITVVSTEDENITASLNIIVKEKPKEKLNITVKGYNLNFDPNIKNYKLKIGNENELKIIANVSNEKIIINGNQNLKNGSIITITVTDETKETYIIEITKKENYTIYFIAVISVLLLINLIRILVKNKKNKN